MDTLITDKHIETNKRQVRILIFVLYPSLFLYPFMYIIYNDECLFQFHTAKIAKHNV